MLLTDEMVEENPVIEYEKEEVVVAAGSHIKQYLKCCPVCSQTIHGRENMLKHMDSHKNKPACQQCLKTLHTSDVLHMHRT
jgi:citrate lyase synthetase